MKESVGIPSVRSKWTLDQKPQELTKEFSVFFSFLFSSILYCFSSAFIIPYRAY